MEDRYVCKYKVVVGIVIIGNSLYKVFWLDKNDGEWIQQRKVFLLSQRDKTISEEKIVIEYMQM
jgi:hypothetical protein